VRQRAHHRRVFLLPFCSRAAPCRGARLLRLRPRGAEPATAATSTCRPRTRTSHRATHRREAAIAALHREGGARRGLRRSTPSSDTIFDRPGGTRTRRATTSFSATAVTASRAASTSGAVLRGRAIGFDR
jgi:hypothetical protein